MMEEEHIILDGHGAQTAEEIDEARKKNVAYEYLCHLEEAKMWMEIVLREQLPPTTELEESLRNGVYLAKLGHFISPDIAPLSKIYDIELRRYKRAGLQFSHTDNINFWLKALDTSGLPKTFHPETTDVYDKKGMPKVIYCIHALSTHLFKLGKAPLIQDLYGKVNFTDAEICNMNKALENNGTPMPAFQKIGGLLSKDLTNDREAFHNAIVTVNEALNKKNTKFLLEALGNPAADIHYIEPSYAQHYWTTLYSAKGNKIQATLNRSASESFTSDEYDDLLTQAEIQGHITSVNVSLSRDEIVDFAVKGNEERLLHHLLLPWLRLKFVYPENISFYIPEIITLKESVCDTGTMGVCIELQIAVRDGNQNAQQKMLVLNHIEKVCCCLKSGTLGDLLKLLEDDILKLKIERIAAPLYFEELKADLKETGKLVYEEMQAGLTTLNHIAHVTKAVDSGDPKLTWNALSNPSAHFSDLDCHLRVKYWQALTEARRLKLVENYEYGVLTYCDIQNSIDCVNQTHDTNNRVVQALSNLNDAVISRDLEGVMHVLQDAPLNLSDNVSPNDGVIYLALFEHRLREKKKDGSALWLEDVKAVVREVLSEVEEVQKECTILSSINRGLLQGDIDSTVQYIIDLGIGVSFTERTNIFSTLRDYRYKKMGSKCPWIIHKTKKENTVFFNIEDCSYSWKEPENFTLHSQFLSRNDIEIIVPRTKRYVSSIKEKLIIRLQSIIRGYLVRRSLLNNKRESSATKIQAWWRGTIQRLRYKTILKHHRQLRKSLHLDDRLRVYKSQEENIIKIQALWRGRQARKAFYSLFHQIEPSFKVVKQFAPYLKITNDDYSKELQLQNLKAQVTQAIRRNQQLAKQLDTMDIKIGLLVQNRISLQDVVAHSKNLNNLTLTNSSGETLALKGLKSLNKESRKRLEGYQHLFYMLQTTPTYLARLLFCLSKDKTSMFIKTVIWSLFNFGTNLREEYLLLKLFRSSLQEEVRLKFSEPSELISSAPLVLNMVADYARQAVGPSSLQNIIGPLVQKVLDDKTLHISTNPIDIYKSWRNQEEMRLGVESQLPISVSPEQALMHQEVQQRLQESIHALKALAAFFLNHIVLSIKLIPYGLLYMARVLQEALVEKFPGTPEKDILKVVGNLIYYHYINPAIIGPETYGIVNLTADNSLSSVQRINLATIAKILQFATVKKGFGEETPYLMCLNSFIIECHKKFKIFFQECCNVEDLDKHFSLHQYSEATLISRPVIYISLQEICDTHKLLVEYLDKIAPDPMDPLCDILEEMGPPPTLATLVGRNPNDSSVTHLAKTELCLTLVNKFEVPEDDETDINKLFIRTKKMLVSLLPCLKGTYLLEALNAPETEEQKALYSELVYDYTAVKNNQFQKAYTSFYCNGNTLSDCKALLWQCLVKLELEGLVSSEDQYQTIITAIAHDICNHGRYREIIRKELETLWQTKLCLDQKMKFYEEQVSLYNEYIETCLKNLNAGKRNVHSLKNSAHHHKVKSKLVLKYSAARLHEKGILLEVDGLPSTQFKNMQFEISPSDVNGIFTICGRFMGVNFEKVDIDVQHLLQLQFEGQSVMDIFGKAKVNVNLLLYLLNKKFYGKNK